MVDSTLSARKTKFYQSITKLDVSQEEATDNMELVEGELESLEATLEATEFKIYRNHKNDAIKAIVELSIVPNVTGKIYAKNLQKGYTTELRRLPALELTIVITEAYPSTQPP